MGPARFLHDGADIAYEVSGAGPALLLLHGFPQTRAMWNRIAPQLAARFTVVTADLRGYGDSTAPPDVAAMSFRAMAGDMVALMRHLGFQEFHVAGHDRGARTAHRMALDAPKAVGRLAVLDIVPTHALLTDLTHPVARAYYHWFFLAQPAPFPERMIAADPEAYYVSCLLGFGKAQVSDFDPEALAAYRQAWQRPEVVTAMCNDYRAAIDVDLAHDAKDLDRPLACPTLVLYGADGTMARLADVPGSWAPRLRDMQAAAIPGGHFFPEQSPDDTARALTGFFAAGA